MVFALLFAFQIMKARKRKLSENILGKQKARKISFRIMQKGRSSATSVIKAFADAQG